MITVERQPNVPITDIEQSAFCRADEPLEAKPLIEEFKAKVEWQKLPKDYIGLKPDELSERIAAARAKLGDQLMILGHHYQRDEIIKFADFRGDSYLLSQHAAKQKEAEYIVFCGVHFMAETADILTGPNQKVILPNMKAGCSMADMAPTEDALDAWEDLKTVVTGGLVPVTYMNSTADIKALCGRNEGIVCTSSNATEAFKWAFRRGEKILFFPDQHLGRNTSLKLGIPVEEMVIWNPFKPLGGLTEDEIRNSKVILWQGHCSVHTRFTVKQINEAREKFPDVQVVVHPECVREVVEAADMDGSTEFIIKVVEEAPAGSVFGIGTEINLVNRLAKENPDKTIFCLDPVVCPCATMYRIHPAYLAWIAEGLVAGNVSNQITVNEDTAHYARLALEQMLSLKRE